MTVPLNRRDLPYIGFLIASFAFGLAFSWQRWGNPLVDCGREMQQPLRLSQGEMLYSEVRHIYGPLSPYLNSLLYRIFGASLNTLYGSGIVTALLIIALCYWLSRQLMNRFASLAASLAVLWLCAFKQAGNYILPYSYSALHGCAFGLITLALLVKAADRSKSTESTESDEKKETGDSQSAEKSRRYYLFASGCFAALTILAKTEMGFAALAAGLAAAFVISYPNWWKIFSAAIWFLLPVLVIAGGVYLIILHYVGWQVFTKESFLLYQNVPPELLYFNKRMSGLDRPILSLISVIGALLRLALAAVSVGIFSSILARRNDRRTASTRVALPDAGHIRISQLWLLLALTIGLTFLLSFAGIMQWDNGPYLAMPVLLIALLTIEGKEFLRQRNTNRKVERLSILLIIFGVYALASLIRVFLRVRSGGAYSSYLLPASVILFTYILAFLLPRLVRDERARRFARNIAISLILGDAIITSFLLAYRYRAKNTFPIVTQRGGMIAVPDLGESFAEAISYIRKETSPNDYIAVMPEGTSLNFFAERRNPLREEITTPGFLNSDGEERAIERLQQTNTKLIFIANRATSEFGPIRFGQDYCQQLMNWIDENYEETETFSITKEQNLKIGDPVFFLKAFRKKQ